LVQHSNTKKKFDLADEENRD
jgi:hypothetical protein